MEKCKLYVDGKWVAPDNHAYVAVENPATEAIIGYAAEAGEEQVQDALAAAERAQKSWGRMSILKRAEYLEKLIALIMEHKVRLATILTKEQGKTYKEALAEVDDTISYIKEAVGSASHIKGDILSATKEKDGVFIKKVPYGVVVALCAWNYPLALVGRKLAPALLTGNTVVLKPHELTPLATVEFFHLFEKAGFPKGVANLITGSGAKTGNLLVSSPITKLVSVTGSVRAGQAIYKAASDHITGLTLELGGKAPFIVLKDADLDQAVEAAIQSRFANCGQICVCSDMVFVEKSIASEFIKKMKRAVKKIKVGDPFQVDTTMGPKASRDDLKKIDGIVKRTIEQGGILECGGKPPKGKFFEHGFWYEPTIISGVTMDMSAAQDEIFGPVLPIIEIEDYEDAVAKTNASPYGLACYLFTEDYRIMGRATQDLDVGTVFINHAVTGEFHVYHGGHKLSGLNGEDGEYGLDAFLQKKTIYVEF